MNAEVARAAAQWWMEQVRRPTFSGLSQQERADPANNAYQLGEAMAFLLADMSIPTETLEAFRDRLQADLEELSDDYVWLDVDYGPCLILRNAADATGIPTTNFPWKTSMSIRDGTITAAVGYHGNMVTVYDERRV